MKAFMFGFNFMQVAGEQFIVSKFSYPRDKARIIYKALKDASLEKYVEYSVDAKDATKYVLCVTAPKLEEGWHPAIQIVKDYAKETAESKQELARKELLGFA